MTTSPGSELNVKEGISSPVILASSKKFLPDSVLLGHYPILINFEEKEVLCDPGMTRNAPRSAVVGCK